MTIELIEEEIFNQGTLIKVIGVGGAGCGRTGCAASGEAVSYPAPYPRPLVCDSNWRTVIGRFTGSVRGLPASSTPTITRDCAKAGR